MKVQEGVAIADRDAQFRYLKEHMVGHQQAGTLVGSVDTKKKEVVSVETEKKELRGSEGRIDPRPVLDWRFVGVMA